MKIVSVQEAKTHLSRLIDQAANGDSCIIAKAGKPMVKVTALDIARDRRGPRLGFLAGQFQVPEDFDKMGRVEIEQLFGIADQ